MSKNRNSPMRFVDATRGYESWLRGHCAVVAGDLRLKHRRFLESPFVFLRGTFYRWMQTWPSVCAELARAPRVLAVGDLHVENFGTWRDAEGRLVWGVNDVDEAYELPYTLDLVRLATSALLATEARHFAVSRTAICDAILEGYAKALARGGRPLVLAERYRWLRRLAVHRLRDPSAFWTKLEANRAAGAGAPPALVSTLPDPRAPYRVLRRVAGVGSLGRPRLVAIAILGGAAIAREAKSAVPSACAWALDESHDGPVYCEPILDRAVRMRDPYFAVRRGWIVRRLAPDCSRIELVELPRERDEARLLRAMGWETGNIHLGSPTSRVRRDLERRPSGWLRDAAMAMARQVARDWREWEMVAGRNRHEK